jgi:hypothetical protein
MQSVMVAFIAEENQKENSELFSISSASNTSLPKDPNLRSSGGQGKSQALASNNNVWSQLISKGYQNPILHGRMSVAWKKLPTIYQQMLTLNKQQLIQLQLFKAKS